MSLQVKYPAHLMAEAKKWMGDDTNSETESECGQSSTRSHYEESKKMEVKKRGIHRRDGQVLSEEFGRL